MIIRSNSHYGVPYSSGVPASVGKINVSMNSVSVFLTWNPPFSLDVVGAEQRIWYNVTIRNMTEGGYPTTVPCTDCLDLTQPFYTFSPDQPSPCHNYSFRVTPWNEAGKGNMSIAVYGTFLAS